MLAPCHLPPLSTRPLHATSRIVKSRSGITNAILHQGHTIRHGEYQASTANGAIQQVRPAAPRRTSAKPFPGTSWKDMLQTSAAVMGLGSISVWLICHDPTIWAPLSLEVPSDTMPERLEGLQAMMPRTPTRKIQESMRPGET